MRNYPWEDSGLHNKSAFTPYHDLGQLLGRELPDRLPGSLAMAMLALERGAKVLRVHDVAATRDVIDTFIAVSQ